MTYPQLNLSTFQTGWYDFLFLLIIQRLLPPGTSAIRSVIFDYLDPCNIQIQQIFIVTPLWEDW